MIAAAMPGAIHAPRMSPYLPITVDQVADEAVRARIVPQLKGNSLPRMRK